MSICLLARSCLGAARPRCIVAPVQAVLTECPKRKRGDPGWFVEAAPTLLPLIASRDTAVSALELDRSGLLSKTRSALRAAVRQAKTRVKHAVAAAKEAWWSKHVSSVNAIRSSATAWESVKMLRAGLKKARKGSTRAMRWNVSVEHPAGELGDGSAEVNAAIFHDHFKQLYGRTPSGKMGVLQHVEQQRVFTELDHEPTEAEILEAVLGKHGRGGLRTAADRGTQGWQQQSGRL